MSGTGGGLVTISAADRIVIADGETGDAGCAGIALVHRDRPVDAFDQGFAIGENSFRIDIDKGLQMFKLFA